MTSSGKKRPSPSHHPQVQALQRWRSLTNGAAGEPSIQSLYILWSRGTGRWLSQQYKNLYIFPECSSSTQQNWGNQEVEPVGPQVVQQGAPYRQWLPRKTVKRAGRRLISKLCQSDERYLLTLQLLISIAGKGKLLLGESEVRKKIIWTRSKKSWFHRLGGLVIDQLSSSGECWHVLWRWIGIIARGWFRFSTVFMTGDADIRLLWRCYRFIARGYCPRSTDVDW